MTEVEAEVAVAKRARGAGAEAGGAGDDLEKLEIVLVCITNTLKLQFTQDSVIEKYFRKHWSGQHNQKCIWVLECIIEIGLFGCSPMSVVCPAYAVESF